MQSIRVATLLAIYVASYNRKELNRVLTGMAWQTSLSHCCCASCSSLQSCGTTVYSASAGGRGGGGIRNCGGGASGMPAHSSQSNMKSSASIMESNIFHICCYSSLLKYVCFLVFDFGECIVCVCDSVFVYVCVCVVEILGCVSNALPDRCHRWTALNGGGAARKERER